MQQQTNTRLFVGGLNFRTTAEDLVTYVETVAPVAKREWRDYDTNDVTLKPKAQIVEDRVEKRSKGFGFVEMETVEGAEAVINQLNDREFDGRRLKIAYAQPREGGERGGNGGGGGYAPRGGGDRPNNNYGSSSNYSAPRGNDSYSASNAEVE